tara:strand:+ start:340 stop:744 length:405 start_codon:yes stop_codon:yes gene_type:complete
MKIRKATKDDEAFIKELHKQHKKHIGNFNLFWVWDKFLEGNTPYTYEIYEEHGFIRYGYSKKYKANVIYEIAVKNGSTQKGVGKDLFNRLKKPIFLKCNEDNVVGNKFYLKMGMTKAGVTITKKGEKQNIYWIT